LKIIEEKFREKNHSFENQVKVSLFAIGDTFGNVAMYEYEQSPSDKKCSLIFLHRNKEIGYSIESLSFDIKGKLLIASTSKHFVLLFYIGAMNKISMLKKVSKKDFFKQSSLHKKNNQLLDQLHFNNFEENESSLNKIQTIQFNNNNKTNKPVFFRKKAISNVINKNIITFKKKPVEKKNIDQIFVEKSQIKEADLFKIKSNSDKNYVAVINLLKEPQGLLRDTFFRFKYGNVHLNFSDSDTIRESEHLSQNEKFKVIVSFNDWQQNASYIKSFKGPCNGIQLNDQFLIVLSENNKMNFYLIKTGKKAMLSFYVPNIYSFSLNENCLLLVKRNSYFSVIDISKGDTILTGNAFELLKEKQNGEEELISCCKFMLSPSNSVYMVLDNKTYVFNAKLKLWMISNNFILFSELENTTLSPELSSVNFPKDPSEIFDHIPFSLIEASNNLSKK
jgi:hypothetical protein